MPNWCENTIEITGKTEDIQRLADAMNNGSFLNAVIPVLEDLRITAGYFTDADKQAEFERMYAENVRKYGVSNWYDFCISKWGTKWDVDCDSVDVTQIDGGQSVLYASFLSAWTPPIGVYEQLIEDGFDVLAYYYEPGMVFAGRFNNDGDDRYQSWESADDAEAMLPKDIDDAFCIVDNLRELESFE
jgi:hypothetical protein